MSGVNPVLVEGPDTVTVNVAVLGGQLVMPDTGGRVKPATAGATTVLGVALEDGQPTSAQTPLNFSIARPEIAICYGDVDIRVTYAASAAWGVKLKAAASGQVTPWISGTDAADLIVGVCTEPAGVSSAAVGRMRLSV
jgi:hypothetical protein